VRPTDHHVNTESLAMSVIGAGIILLVVIWALAIALAIVLSYRPPPISYAGPIGAVCAATLLTISLWFSHLALSAAGSSAYPVVYDYSYVGRLLIVLFCGGGLVGGLAACFVFDVNDRRRAARLKASSWNDMSASFA
jgi:hypothetical protein